MKDENAAWQEELAAQAWMKKEVARREEEKRRKNAEEVRRRAEAARLKEEAERAAAAREVARAKAREAPTPPTTVGGVGAGAKKTGYWDEFLEKNPPPPTTVGGVGVGAKKTGYWDEFLEKNPAPPTTVGGVGAATVSKPNKMVSARNMDLWLSSILRDENRKTWEKDARAREKPEPPRIAAYVDYGGGFDGGGASRSIEDDEPMSVINSLGYGSELIAQGALQGIEGFSDFIGGGLTGVLQYASSVGGLFPNAFSDEMGKWNEYYLSEGIASDYAASIEERYKPNDFERNLGKINSAFGGMLPAAATSLLGAGGLAAQGIQVISNAGNSASNAYAQSGDVDQSMLYGGLKGLADSAISQIAGGNPFFAKGKVTSALAGAIKNPVIKKVAQNIYDVAGEGVEGGLMTALDPLLQRMSFNENAENAGIGEIAESAVFDSLVSLGLKSGVRLSDMFADGKIDKNLFSDYYGDRVKTKAYDLAAGDGNTITAQYDSSTARHVISGDGITKNGVSGAHNGDNFKKAIRNYGVAPIQGPDSVTNHPTIKGIYNQKYLIPRNDGMGMRAKIFKKTLYDPRIISNKKMMRWSNEALSRAQIEMGSNGSYTIAGKAENGLKFNGFIRDGRITSFYPVIKKD